jgi:lysophospholipase L1-like esterase
LDFRIQRRGFTTAAAGRGATHMIAPCVRLALAALLALLAAPVAQAHAADGDVLVVGDSLAVGTQPFLEPMLGGVHLVSDVRNGITTPQGMRLLRMSLRTVTPATVIVSLGTNDGGDPRRFRNRLSRTMALLPVDTCVVWSTIIRPRRKGPYRPLNRVLHAFKRQEPRLVVVDWEHAVSGGAVVLPDGLHADPEGYRYRSTMIADAVNAGCPARLATG